MRQRAGARLRELGIAAYHGWFAMTRSEQHALLLVLGLFLLGLAVKWWRDG